MRVATPIAFHALIVTIRLTRAPSSSAENCCASADTTAPMRPNVTSAIFHRGASVG